MCICDSDFFFLFIIFKEKSDFSFNIDRSIELRNLIAHRQIRIEIGLSIKSRTLIEAAVERFSEEESLFYDFLTELRQSTWLSSADRTNIGIGKIGIKVLLICAATKNLGLGREFEVDFKSDSNKWCLHDKEKRNEN